MLVVGLCAPATLSQANERPALFEEITRSFTDAYNEQINAAYFKEVLIDAARLSLELANLYRNAGTFPSSVAETPFTVMSAHIESVILLNDTGSFRLTLSNQFGVEKFLTMLPVIQGGELLSWTCQTNLPPAVVEGTFCRKSAD